MIELLQDELRAERERADGFKAQRDALIDAQNAVQQQLDHERERAEAYKAALQKIAKESLSRDEYMVGIARAALLSGRQT